MFMGKIMTLLCLQYNSPQLEETIWYSSMHFPVKESVQCSPGYSGI